MEKHRCKLCLRKFANGRALGGHMRSHMMAQKKEEQRKAKDDQQQQLRSEEFELVQSFSSSSSEEENKEDSKKKSKGFADPECCFAVEAGCVVVQDRESETESSKNKNCGRSKRVRTSRISNTLQWWIDQKKLHKCAKIGKPDESEPVSSISDTTPEEDVAYSLMMLSRDKWMKEEKDEEDGDDEGEDRAEEQEEEGGKKCVDDDHGEDVCAVKVTKAGCRGKYRCETCNKVFRSYQALGGHRASHKKVKFINYTANQEASEMVMETENAGGHKRSHFAGAATTSVNVDKPFSRMIDLNLPAPLDDDDGDEISQMEVSAVSDAECANPIWD